jgi:putative ABC transport system permease protein
VRFSDLLGLAFFALRRHKLRTLLTTLGVLFGTLVLVVSLAIRQGVQRTITQQVTKYAELRRIEVRPGAARPTGKVEPVKGRMSDDRRQRLQEELRDRQGGGMEMPPEHMLTPERIKEISELEHVNSAEPVIQQHGRVLLGDHSVYASFFAIPAELRDRLTDRLVAGEMLSQRDPQGALVSEIMLYQLGIVDEEDVRRAVGRTFEFEVRVGNRPAPSFLLQMLTGAMGTVGVADEELLDKLLKRLPDSLDRLGLTPSEQKAVHRLIKLASANAKKATTQPDFVRASFTIRGVLRKPTPEETRRRNGWMLQYSDVLLAPDAAQAFYLRLPRTSEDGFRQVVIQVDDPANVKSVQQQIRDMGLHADSAIDYIEREEFMYLMSVTAMSVVALIALLVAAIGITNTMLMSVLERFREIGVMKALGARDSQVQALFLMEGALIGAVGGLMGLAAAWGSSFPADAWLRVQVAQRLNVKLDGSLFAFPWWLLVGGPVFAVLVTTLAAYYPARRAIRIDPVQALRHE